MIGINIPGREFLKARMFQIFFVIYLIGGIAAVYISMIGGLNREHIGMAFSGGAILCLFLIRVGRPISETPVTSGAEFKIATTLWFLVFIFSTLCLLNSLGNYYLSLPYFVSISTLSLIIGYQILGSKALTRIQVSIVFAEIVTLAVFLSASIIYLFPATIGLDSVFHASYISSIIQSGGLYTGFFDKYANYPIYHLAFAGIMMLSGIDLPTAELVLAFVQVLAVLFVFVFCARVFGEKVALLAALLITLSSQLIIPRYSLFPSSYAVIFYMLLIFILFHFAAKRNIWPVMVVALAAVSLMHPYVSIVSAFTLAFLYLIHKLFGFDKIVGLRYVLLSAALMVLQIARPIPDSYSYSLTYLIYVQIARLLTFSTSVTQASLSQFQTWRDMLLYDMGFMLLIMFGVCGALLMLRQSLKNDKNLAGGRKDIMFDLSILTLIMLPIPYVMAIVAPNALPERWFVFISIFLGIFAAVALYTFSRSSRYLKYVVILAVPVIIFFMVTAPISNPNTHIYLEKLATTPSVKLSESFAAGFLRSHVNLSLIYANSLVIPWIDHSIDYSLGTQGHIIDLTEPDSIYDGHVLLIRNYDMENGFTVPLQGNKGMLLEIDKPTSAFTRYIDNADKFYDSGEIRVVLGYNDGSQVPDNLTSIQE